MLRSPTSSPWTKFTFSFFNGTEIYLGTGLIGTPSTRGFTTTLEFPIARDELIMQSHEPGQAAQTDIHEEIAAANVPYSSSDFSGLDPVDVPPPPPRNPARLTKSKEQPPSLSSGKDGSTPPSPHSQESQEIDYALQEHTVRNHSPQLGGADSAAPVLSESLSLRQATPISKFSIPVWLDSVEDGTDTADSPKSANSAISREEDGHEHGNARRNVHVDDPNSVPKTGLGGPMQKQKQLEAPNPEFLAFDFQFDETNHYTSESASSIQDEKTYLTPAEEISARPNTSPVPSSDKSQTAQESLPSPKVSDSPAPSAGMPEPDDDDERSICSSSSPSSLVSLPSAPSEDSASPKTPVPLTLFDKRCLTKRSDIKALHDGPKYEFCSTNSSPPYATNISERLLLHFCGQGAVNRLRDRYLAEAESEPSIRAPTPTSSPGPGGEKEDEDESDYEEELTYTLVIPSDDYAPTAIIRILRYMRRCTLSTSSRPLYQIGVPPLVRDQLHTMMGCRLFGLHADSERLEAVLLRQTIPRGPLTMEDVECIWEGWGGVLRASSIVDALLWYILHEVVGKEGEGKEDIRMLFEEEEYAVLRVAVSEELGLRAWREEKVYTFLKRKAKERSGVQERWDLTWVDDVCNVAAREGEGEERISGRLLRILSDDALAVTDATAKSRYKRVSREVLRKGSLESFMENQAVTESLAGGSLGDNEGPKDLSAAGLDFIEHISDPATIPNTGSDNEQTKMELSLKPPALRTERSTSPFTTFGLEEVPESACSSAYSRVSEELLVNSASAIPAMTPRLGARHAKAPRPLSERGLIDLSQPPPRRTRRLLSNWPKRTSSLISVNFKVDHHLQVAVEDESAAGSVVVEPRVPYLVVLDDPMQEHIDLAARQTPQNSWLSSAILRASQSAPRLRASTSQAMNSFAQTLNRRTSSATPWSTDKPLPAIPLSTENTPPQPLVQQTQTQEVQQLEPARTKSPDLRNNYSEISKTSRWHPLREAPKPRSSDTQASSMLLRLRTTPCPTCGRSSPMKGIDMENFRVKGTVYLKNAWDRVQGKQ